MLVEPQIEPSGNNYMQRFKPANSNCLTAKGGLGHGLLCYNAKTSSWAKLPSALLGSTQTIPVGGAVDQFVDVQFDKISDALASSDEEILGRCARCGPKFHAPKQVAAKRRRLLCPRL